MQADHDFEFLVELPGSHDVVRKTEAGWRFVSRTYVPRWKVDSAVG